MNAFYHGTYFVDQWSILFEAKNGIPVLAKIETKRELYSESEINTMVEQIMELGK